MFDLFFAAFATLFVAIGPFEAVPIFLALTGRYEPKARRNIALVAVGTATFVLFAFALGGIQLLGLLGVGLPAFRTAGGILLMMVAADLLLAKHSGISSITDKEEDEAKQQTGIAVVPLAIPLIAGPGSMTAIVLLMGKVDTLAQGGFVLGALIVVMLITLISMLAGNRLMKILGVTGANAVARVSGILLAALAMQFIFDGLIASHVFG